MRVVATLLTVLILTSSCVTSLDKGAKANEAPEDDGDYYPSLVQATRRADVIKDFEMIYRVNATYLSNEFRSSLNKRLDRLYFQNATGSFEEAASKAGFFVTIFSPDSRSIEITNSDHWSIFLETKDGKFKPSLVKRINDKLRWRHFFDSINFWSVEYLIVFDTASVNPATKSLVEKPITKLSLASGAGNVQLVW
jgi:hypothetical protein